MKKFISLLITVICMNSICYDKIFSQEITKWQTVDYFPIQISNSNYFWPGIFYGDFDHNNFLDIIIGHRHEDGKVTLLLNNENGKFHLASTISTIPYPTTGVVTDFNNDNKLDFAFAHSSAYNGDNRISVHLGKGDGTFQNYITYTVQGSYTKFLDVGDLNNDGYQDIVVSSAGWPDCFSVLLNDGDGTFTLKNHYFGGEEPNDIRLADFNNDNILDVIMSCFWDYGEINIYFGKGDGTFDNAVPYLQDYGTVYKSGPKPIDIVDLDNQNGLDIIIGITSDPFTRVYFYKMINQGDGSFADSLVTTDYYPIKAFDWNHDRNIDILANRYNYSTTTGSNFLGVALLQNDGTGKFMDMGFVKLDATGNFADLNNDGLLDFAFIKGISDSIGVYLQAGVSKAPKILKITDVPHDQGGKVTLKWHASALDSNLTTLAFYSIWRALPERKPAVRLISIKNITEDFQGPALRLETINGREYAWEWLANQPAHRLATYTYTAATLYDSMSTTDGKHYFMVSAHTSDPNVFYDSHVDSGYSVDNLAPLAPRNLVAGLMAAGIRLHWSPAPEADLRQYLLYRSQAPNIEPAMLTPFATSRDTVLLDATPLTSSTYYVVCAQDIHDNRSPKSNEAVVSVTDLQDAAGKFPTSFRLDQNHPNPFNATTTIRYEIPDARRVTLTIYDLLGKEIAALIQEQQAAGEYSVQWNAENLPSGIYVYRLVAGELVAIKKLILMK